MRLAVVGVPRTRTRRKRSKAVISEQQVNTLRLLSEKPHLTDLQVQKELNCPIRSNVTRSLQGLVRKGLIAWSMNSNKSDFTYAITKQGLAQLKEE